MENSTVLAALCALAVLAYVFRRDKLRHIPSVGGSGYFSSWYGAFRFMAHGREMLEEGHRRYKGRVFKVPHLMGWHVLVSTPQLIEELRRAPDEQLSFHDAVGDSLQIEYTMGKPIAHNQYHTAIIRSQLTRSLGALFPEILDEIQTAWNETIPAASGDGWIKMPALQTVLQVVSRTSNRIFVGLPLCRNKELSKVAIGFTLDVVKAGLTLNMVPELMRPLVAAYCTTVNGAVDKMVDILGPTIEERLRMYEENKDNLDALPVDMLTWLANVAPEGVERTARLIAQRILVLDFAAIHTSSMSFTHALYMVAAHPEYAGPLREEVESVLAQEGWSKMALQKMRKLDSFMRESQRVYGLGLISMSRKCLVDFTFSDGTTVPKGATVSACLAGTHFDEEHYADPHVFDPWRFAAIRAEEGEELKHQMVHTSAEYVTFGYGRHACPGRFFAATELKAMMAHLLVNYDIKAEVPGVVPEPRWFAQTVAPNDKASVLLRRRDGKAL